VGELRYSVGACVKWVAYNISILLEAKPLVVGLQGCKFGVGTVRKKAHVGVDRLDNVGPV
jgi:hypothetical protein